MLRYIPLSKNGYKKINGSKTIDIPIQLWYNYTMTSIIYTKNTSGAIRKARRRKPKKSEFIALKKYMKYLKYMHWRNEEDLENIWNMGNMMGSKSNK